MKSLKCPSCRKGDIRIVKTVRATESARTSEGECTVCGIPWTLVVTIVGQAQGRGNGAHATSTKLRNGKLRVKIETVS